MFTSIVFRYVPDPDFKPEIVKNASRACEGLVKWVGAMEKYDRVAKVVAPKKKALAEAESELDTQMTELNKKRAQLEEVCGLVDVLIGISPDRWKLMCLTTNFQHMSHEFNT
jgi:hypothetical protein